jgi:large subunit ribosomal protein L19
MVYSSLVDIIRKGGVPMADLLKSVEQAQFKTDVPTISVGDTVKVHNRIVEGDRERIQVVQGTVMKLGKGGLRACFTVRRTAANGVGVERTFMIHSPRIDKIEVVRHAYVRRAQLYFLRGRQEKSARLKERRG